MQQLNYGYLNRHDITLVLGSMIQILLVDDQKLIRQGLKALLELDPDIQVVGSVSNGESAIEQVEALKPDIVL
jgi:YesN/AraC family two-component response regulator